MATSAQQRELDSAFLLRLPSDLHEQLRQIALAEDRSMAGLLRLAAQQIVDSRQKTSAA